MIPLTTKAASPRAREKRASGSVGGPQRSPEVGFVLGSEAAPFPREAFEKGLVGVGLARVLNARITQLCSARPSSTGLWLFSEVAGTTSRRATTLSRVAESASQGTTCF